MASWILEDDCLAPERTMRIDYKGPNPFRIYHAIPGFLRAIFEVRGKDVWEREFRWDYSGDPRDFFFRFIVRRSFDFWSTIYVELIAQGKQPSDPNKDGEMFVIFTGKLQTKSPENTAWARSSIYKSLRWIYFRTLYNDIRRNLIEECRIRVGDLIRSIQETLGISPEVVMR